MPSLLLTATPMLLTLQLAQGGIRGTITDEDSRAPLAGVTVALTDLDRAAVSDEAGRYVFAGVPAGPQHVAIRRIGYASRTLHALVPGAGALEINVALRRLPVLLRRVEVRPALAIRGVETDVERAPSPARTISMAAVRNHPLLAEPDAFLALSGGDIVMRPESPAGMHVAGGASDQTAYLLDGVPIFSPYHAAGSFSAWNPDALDRIHVASVPSAGGTDALAGTVAGFTRVPGAHLRVQGGTSTTQLRLTMDGPLGGSDAGYLVSVRSGFPGTIAPPEESSYLRGETADLLVTARVPAGRSRLAFLAYDAGNEFGASAVAEGVATPDSLPRQLFKWNSRSVGVRWEYPLGHAAAVERTTLQFLAWRANADATARWTPETGERLDVASRREDVGVRGSLTHTATGTTTAGAWLRSSRTAYHVARASGQSDFTSGSREPLAAAFVRHQHPLSRSVSAALALSASAGTNATHIAPQAQVQWEPRADLALTGAYARSFQHAQSVRNPESVVGAIFPADLYVGAGKTGVPVARSDLGLIGATYRPRSGVRLGIQVYSRRSRDLLLVAPGTGEPFVSSGWSIGTGRARGVAIDGAWSAARYGVVASYAWQAVRVRHGDSTYVPDFGASHAAEAGVVVFPSPTFSIRVGGTLLAGRRGTSLSSPFEWEACNLLDRGCEFGGAPGYDPAQLGRTALPSYARLDLGVRKHWHVSIARRDVQLEGFGTVTNILGRANVLTFAVDPTTGNPAMLEMRPRAPLVVGLDWRF